MLRVLVVEDDADTLETLAMLLEAAGYGVRTARDGHTALTFAAEFRPDAVILDLAMPRMSGYELARKMRETYGAGLNIICVSGYGTEADRERTRVAGFDHHLLKPGEPDALFRVLGPPTDRTDPAESRA